MFLNARKTFTILISLLCGIAAFGQTYQNVTMTVGETKTLYLPSSVTSKYLKSCQFYAASPAYADIKSHSAYSVTVVAKKAYSAAVIIRCDYTYYVLRNGKYVYGGIGAYDFRITVKDIPVTSITLPETETIEVGTSKTLTPTVYPSNATSELTWWSSSYSTINIDSKTGRMLAQRSGTSVITVTSSNGKSASCTVTAYRPETVVTSVSVSPPTLSLTVGSERHLSSTVYPSDATDKTVKWSSTDPSVATVSASGMVKAISAGYATIYATSNNGKRGSCDVTCKEAIPDLTLTDRQDAPAIPAKANVTYQRTFYSGWNSLCVPFAVKASYIDGCRLAIVRDREIRGADRYFSFTVVDEVAAGTPCLVWVAQDAECTISLKEQALAESPVNTGIMKGSYSNTAIGAGCYKLAPDGGSFSITTGENATVTAYGTYINLH